MDLNTNVVEYVTKATKALQGDKNLMAQFTKEPVKAIEAILGVDLPDEVINKVIEAVKAQLSGGEAAAKESSNILGKAADALKKIF